MLCRELRTAYVEHSPEKSSVVKDKENKILEDKQQINNHWKDRFVNYITRRKENCVTK